MLFRDMIDGIVVVVVVAVVECRRGVFGLAEDGLHDAHRAVAVGYAGGRLWRGHSRYVGQSDLAVEDFLFEPS